MTDEPAHPHHAVDTAAMREIRDRLIEISKAHEAAIHNGEQCLSFRYGAIAYMTHVLGLSIAHALPIMRTIAIYEHRHTDPVRIHPHPEI